MVARQGQRLQQRRPCILTHRRGTRPLPSPPPKARRLQCALSLSLPSSAPHPRSLVFDDGRSHLLLCVHGLLPISYRNAQYNIPVAIWVTREYPRHPPIVYVVPSADLLVKASRSVDVSGRCNLEYMQHWERKSEVCRTDNMSSTCSDVICRDVISLPSSTLWWITSPVNHPSMPNQRALLLSPLCSLPAHLPTGPSLPSLPQLLPLQPHPLLSPFPHVLFFHPSLASHRLSTPTLLPLNPHSLLRRSHKTQGLVARI